MEQPEARAKDNIARGSQTVCHAYPRVEVLPLRIEYTRWPSFELPAQTAIQSQTRRGAPLVFNV